MEKNNKILVETLIRGRNSALTLRNFLGRKANDDGSVSIDDLLKEISESLFDGLSILNSSGAGEVQLGSSEVLTGKIPPPAIEKKGRGRYKRRRGVDSRIIVSDTIADAYEWRKYGQKEILNSQFPRCYFRCTHKDRDGCKALKQVQRLEEEEEEESNKFHITYFGHHTCPTPHVVSHHGPGVLLDFEGFRNHGNLLNNPSTIKKIYIDSSRKQNDKKVSSSPSLVSMETSINDFKAQRFNDQDSCSANITDSFENGDFLDDISVDDVLSMVESYWGEYNLYNLESKDYN